MSRAYKPTWKQKQVISAAGLIVRNWLVVKETEDKLQIVHKGTGRGRTLKKGR